LEANAIFSPIVPLVCPRCERELDQTDEEIEKSGQCRVCHHVAPIASSEKQKQLRLRLMQTELELTQSEALLRENEDQRFNLRQRAVELVQCHTRLIIEANQSFSQITFADNEKLGEIILAMGKVSQRITDLKEKLSPEERHEIAESEGVRDKLKIVSELRRLLEESSAAETKDITRRFEMQMLPILNEIESEEPVDDVNIGPDALPIIMVGGTTKSFRTQMPEGQQARVAISYYLAMLLHGLDDVGRMPSFLLLDSPGQQEMKPEDVRGLSQRLRVLGERYSDRLQIIVASRYPEIIDAAPDVPAHKIIPTGDDYIFKRTSTHH
jgi:hypothetical protein